MNVRKFVAIIKRKDDVKVNIDNGRERLLKDIVINSDDNIEMVFADEVMEIPTNKVKIYSNKEVIILYVDSKKYYFYIKSK